MENILGEEIKCCKSFEDFTVDNYYKIVGYQYTDNCLFILNDKDEMEKLSFDDLKKYFTENEE